jgi:hypothetical protein
MTLQASAGTGGGLTVLVFQVAALVAFVWVLSRFAKKRSQSGPPTHICRNCGNAVHPVETSKVNGCFLFVLLLCFIIPGILYWVWAGTQRAYKCPKCSAENSFVPVDSPEGKRLVGSVAPSGIVPQSTAPSQRNERSCPWCAEPILAEAQVCKHCQREVAPMA